MGNGFYINTSTFHHNKFFSSLPSYEEHLGSQSQQQNYYAKGMGRNNSFYSAIKRNYRKGVIGTGFNVQSKTGEKLKDGSDFDKAFEKQIKQWSKRGNCELSGRFYFAEAQRSMVDEYTTAGGYILRHHFSKSFSHGYKFEIIPLQLIDTAKHDIQDRTFNGIKVNKNGEIISIWIYTDFVKNESKEIKYSNLTLSVNKLFDPTQYSGVSPLVSVFESMEYIDAYKSTQMEGANRRNRNPIMIHSPLTKMMMAQSAKEHAEAVYKAGGGKISIEPNYDLLDKYWQMQRLDTKKVTSDFAYLRDDETVTETGKAVDNIYADMYKNESRSASAGVGLTASSLVGEVTSSYTASIKGVSDEENEYKTIAQDLGEGCIAPMIEVQLLNGVVSNGLLDLPNYWENPTPYRNIYLLRRERGHIDPVKTAKATTEDVHVNKTKTMIRALAEKGIDADEYLEEVERWEKKKHKITMGNLKRELEVKKEYEKLGVEYTTNAFDQQVLSSITESDLGEQ